MEYNCCCEIMANINNMVQLEVRFPTIQQCHILEDGASGVQVGDIKQVIV